MRLFLLGVYALLFMACSTVPPSLYHQLSPSSLSRGQTYDLSSASYRSIESLSKKLDHYQLIFIGDHHSEDDLHLKISSLFKALHKQGRGIVLGNEWFTPDQNKLLDSFVEGSISEEKFLEKTSWTKRIGFEYKSFKPLYDFIIKSKGRLRGINLTKEQQKDISQRNLKSMNASDKLFYEKLDLNTTIHQTMLEPFFKDCHAYSHSIEDCEQRMYRVQVAWESKMAYEVLKLFKKLDKDEVLIVFTGAMHLENGLGVNLRFSRLSDQPFLTLIPRHITTKKVPLGLADAIVFYEPKLDQE